MPAGKGENQHFVNVGYLRGFTIPEEKSLIIQYDKRSGRVRQSSIKKVCSKDDYYASWGLEGKSDPSSIERKFGNLIEQPSTLIIKRLNPVAPGPFTLAPEDKVQLSVFIGTLLSRGPAFRAGVEGGLQELVMISLENMYHAGNLPEMPPELQDLVDKKGIRSLKVQVKSEQSIKPMLEVGFKVAESLMGKKWAFLMPSKGMAFVTSDTPVSFRLPDEVRENYGDLSVGPDHPLSELTIPLRKDVMLVCHPVIDSLENEASTCDGAVIELTKAQTEGANVRPIQAAQQYVYASEKSEVIAKQVAALRLTSQRVTVS